MRPFALQDKVRSTAASGLRPGQAPRITSRNAALKRAAKSERRKKGWRTTLVLFEFRDNSDFGFLKALGDSDFPGFMDGTEMRAQLTAAGLKLRITSMTDATAHEIRPIRLYDAHNHLQDERLGPDRSALMIAARNEGVQVMVVNGATEEDWEAVSELARRWESVLPSFGYHPWHVKERSVHWLDRLRTSLDAVPAAIGEIGLDRWIQGHDLADQESVFIPQLRLAAERNLPVTIHCLQAWGRLLEILEAEPRPACGFVLHSFGGPAEMIPALARLGAYFSLPGYFALERKSRQREAFLRVPADRLLIETDAPDQSLPPERVRYPLPDSQGRPVNHPANLVAVYQFAAELLEEPFDQLSTRVEQNFLRLFGEVLRARERILDSQAPGAH